MGSVAGWIVKLAMAPILVWMTQDIPQAPTTAGGVADKTVDGRLLQLTDPNAEPLPIRDIAPGANVTWSTDEMARPLRLRADGVIVTIRTVAIILGNPIVQPQILVEAPGLSPVLIEGADARIGYEHMIGIG